jgi:hypothetical protein
MKILTKILLVLLFFSDSLMASVQLEIGNSVVVETVGGIYVVIDGELNEVGTGYFKGKISSGDRAALTAFAGMDLSVGIDGSITRTTGSGYDKGNGEGPNFLRFYEVNNSRGVLATDMEISFISSGSFDERNSLTVPYYIYRYSTNWNGYGEGASAFPLSAFGIHILSGPTDWVISDGSFILFTDSEVATTGTPILFNEPAEGGDGHDVVMTLSDLTGNGNVTVEQTNRVPSDLLSNKCLNYFWEITKDAGITSFSTDVTFKYLDGDLLDVNENMLIAAHYDAAQTGWSVLQDYTLDELNNTLTVHDLDHFTVFAIGEAEAFSSSVSAKVFLEGPFDTGSMLTTLLSSGHLPLAHPYGDAPWNYSGSESVMSIPGSVVDWVLVEIRSSTEASSKVATRAAFVKSDGNVVDLDGISPVKFEIAAGEYYICIHHRNHLSIMSAATHAINSSSELYDFTASLATAFSAGPAAMRDLGGGSFGMFSSDANGDGQVTSSDFNVFLPAAKAAETGYHMADWNLDGQVTSSDFNIFNPNAKNAARTQVPGGVVVSSIRIKKSDIKEGGHVE